MNDESGIINDVVISLEAHRARVFSASKNSFTPVAAMAHISRDPLTGVSKYEYRFETSDEAKGLIKGCQGLINNILNEIF